MFYPGYSVFPSYYMTHVTFFTLHAELFVTCIVRMICHDLALRYCSCCDVIVECIQYLCLLYWLHIGTLSDFFKYIVKHVCLVCFILGIVLIIVFIHV